MKFTAGAHLPYEEKFTVIIGQGVASALELKVGDSIALLVNTQGGALNTFDFTIVGIFQTFSKEFDERAIRIPLSAAQELLATKAVHSLVFLLRDTMRTDEVAREIMQLYSRKEYEVKTWYELADFYQKTVDLYKRYFYVLYLIILGLVLLSVANNISMTIYERTGEFGTLMALGNRGAAIFKLILAEIFLLGLIGSGAGLLLGGTVAGIISAIGIPMPPMPNTNTGYTARILVIPEEALKSLMIGLIGSIIAAVWPARRASTRRVAEALRHN
jgi:putative ABC transport system permease protein